VEPCPLPPLLGGPQASELLLDRPEDADKPHVRVRALDAAVLAAFLAPDAAAAPGCTGSSAVDTGPAPVLPLAAAAAALDAAKDARAAAAVREAEARAEAFNALLPRPHVAAVRL
jgi:hypothetical protein